MTPEERIRSSAGKLSRFPDAVEILHASLSKVLTDPLSERFRKVNANAGAFRERVSSKTTAGVELLYAVGYQPLHGFLVLQTHDPRLLHVALEALQAARAAPSYVEKKAQQDGERTRRAAAADDAAEAAARRAA